MQWFQNTYTRHFNVKHKLWGHLFGGRYKAVLVQSDEGDYFSTLIDYVHLNPVRAGMIRQGKVSVKAFGQVCANTANLPRNANPGWLPHPGLKPLT